VNLATARAVRRIKEVGIRKVLGTSVTKIMGMFIKDYVKWLLVANVIAWPIAYLTINKWRQNFAYRINISFRMFVISGALALMITLLTVSTQAIRAALANPVESLRYE